MPSRHRGEQSFATSLFRVGQSAGLPHPIIAFARLRPRPPWCSSTILVLVANAFYVPRVIALLPVIVATLATAPADHATLRRPELVILSVPVVLPTIHPFWDWQNLALFSGVAAARSFDYFSTRKFRERHLKEWLLDNNTVDNRPLFAVIEVAGTVLSVGASYVLHRTGYHRLERWASILHIGFATAGGIWNSTLPNGL